MEDDEEINDIMEEIGEQGITLPGDVDPNEEILVEAEHAPGEATVTVVFHGDTIEEILEEDPPVDENIKRFLEEFQDEK